MDQIRAIDTAWKHPDYAKVRSVGYVAVFRYLSKDPSKNLVPTERDGIHAQGLGIGLVWEAGATDWQDPNLAVDEAKEAVAQAQALGVPEGTCIYAANDAASTLQQVFPGFVKARPVIKDAGYLFGFYGPDTVGDPLVAQGVVDQEWQAAAVSWGDGKVSSVASVFQRVAKTLPDCGGDYDENVLLKFPAGLWLPASQSVPPGGTGAGPALPAPVPKLSAPPFPGRLLSFPPLVSGADVRAWQAQMQARGWSLTADGMYGPQSRSVCLAFQRQKGLIPDGVVGPVTWAASWVAPVTRS